MDAAMPFLLENHGHVSMAEIVSQAGVSRATFYRHFSDREDLLLALAERECGRVEEQVEARLRGIISVSNYIVEAVLEMLEMVQANTFLMKQLRKLPAEQLKSENGILKQILKMSQSVLMPMLTKGMDTGMLYDDVSVGRMEAWISRCFVMLLLVPQEDAATRFETRDLLEDMLLPALLSS